jgi:hypothetical protein
MTINQARRWPCGGSLGGHIGSGWCEIRDNRLKGGSVRTHSRKTWPPFLAFALLGFLGVFVLDDVAAGVVSFVAVIVLVGGCIYALAGEDVQDGCGGIGGGTSF